MRLNPTDFDIEVGLSIVEISEECEMIIDDGYRTYYLYIYIASANVI